ncbi:MAG: hypothetical protein MZV49_10675 [Rhodopseudomonas palustris]|nr:hypothetical protein [Rhodopseudomonas palustris]
MLRAIADWLPPDAPCPFEVLVGTSAGALNAAALGGPRPAGSREAVEQLEQVWSGLQGRAGRPFRCRHGAAGRPALGGLAAVGRLARRSPPRSLLDTSPLRELLQQVDASRADSGAASPPVRCKALAVATTSYTTGQAVAFFEAVPSRSTSGSRVRRARSAADHRPRRADGKRRDPVHLPGGTRRRRPLRRRRHAPARPC